MVTNSYTWKIKIPALFLIEEKHYRKKLFFWFAQLLITCWKETLRRPRT